MWSLPDCNTLDAKLTEMANIKRGLHDPLRYGAGLTKREVLQWRLMGKLHGDAFILFHDISYCIQISRSSGVMANQNTLFRIDTIPTLAA